MGKLDDVIDSSLAAIIGIALLCAAVIPIGVDFIGGLTGESTRYQGLLYLVITMCVLGLVIGVIRFYSNSKR